MAVISHRVIQKKVNEETEMKYTSLLTAVIFLILPLITIAEKAADTVSDTTKSSSKVPISQRIGSSQQKEAQNRILTDITKPIIVDASHPEVVIRLAANPSTGYQWFLSEYDQNLITSTDYKYEPAEGQMVGASGVDIWTFKVDEEAFSAPHVFKLKLEYRRPFEDQTEKTTVITIITISE